MMLSKKIVKDAKAAPSKKTALKEPVRKPVSVATPRLAGNHNETLLQG
jgi:hypothetical protein